jgi:hypothetical protein
MAVGDDQAGAGGERAVEGRNRMHVDEQADRRSGQDPVAALCRTRCTEREKRGSEHGGDEQRVHPGERGE